MDKSELLRARITKFQQAKLEDLCKRSGYTKSQLVRLLIDHAVLEPWRITTVVRANLENAKDAEQAV